VANCVLSVLNKENDDDDDDDDDVQDCQGVSASEMTYIVSSGALNSIHSLTQFPTS